jgi:7,8-dihydropterin-6-yl-methyl-4-(beta-D-ribofuranosyl)aminobenzene 5'-phosphate synthase
MLLSGPIGGNHQCRDIFVVRRGDDMIVDGFEDELCLLLRGEDGWTVVTGCCHRGIRNTLRAAKFLTHNEPIVRLLGGLHLRGANEQELMDVVEQFQSLAMKEICPGHCTGEKEIAFLSEKLPGRVKPLKSGEIIVV